MSPGVTVHWELHFETQRLLAPVQNRRIGRRLAEVLCFFMVAAARQGPEVLTIVPGDAAAAVQPWSFRAPTNVVATPRASSRIDIAWQDESPNESGFQVFRCGASVEFTEVATTAANISSWSDSGLLASTQYCYLVRACRADKPSSTYSTNSNTSCAMTLAPPPPPSPVAPSWAFATPLDSATISIEWRDNSLVEDGFRVERSTDAGATWRTAATVASDMLS